MMLSLSSSSSVGMDEININLRFSNGERSSVRLPTVGLNVVDFKNAIAQTFHLCVEELKLIHRGIIWQDDRTLDSYGVQAHHTIYVVRDPLLPLIKGIVDSDHQLATYRKLLTDPLTHYDVDPSDVMNQICQANPPDTQMSFRLRLQIYEYMFENIQETFPNATTVSGGAATQTPPATLCDSAITT
ncbi:ubiquitin domain-containing protein DSK2b-like protein isoform X1 [Tanacetum coccineum]